MLGERARGLDPVPAFDDLPLIEKLGLRHAWGVFGPDDQRGTINFITPEARAAAAATVTEGQSRSGSTCR